MSIEKVMNSNRKRLKDKERRQRRAERVAAGEILKVKKMSVEEYILLLEYQGGGCATCGAKRSHTGRRLCVDHCHRTVVIRGILCDSCNISLGLLKDNIETLKSLVAYLEKSMVE